MKRHDIWFCRGADERADSPIGTLPAGMQERYIPDG